MSVILPIKTRRVLQQRKIRDLHLHYLSEENSDNFVLPPVPVPLYNVPRISQIEMGAGMLVPELYQPSVLRPPASALQAMTVGGAKSAYIQNQCLPFFALSPAARLAQLHSPKMHDTFQHPQHNLSNKIDNSARFDQPRQSTTQDLLSPRYKYKMNSEKGTSGVRLSPRARAAQYMKATEVKTKRKTQFKPLPSQKHTWLDSLQQENTNQQSHKSEAKASDGIFLTSLPT